MQLGSNTLGRVNEEDVEKGLVYWDVFKTAKLDVLKPRQLDEGVYKLNQQPSQMNVCMMGVCCIESCSVIITLFSKAHMSVVDPMACIPMVWVHDDIIVQHCKTSSTSIPVL